MFIVPVIRVLFTNTIHSVYYILGHIQDRDARECALCEIVDIFDIVAMYYESDANACLGDCDKAFSMRQYRYTSIRLKSARTLQSALRVFD